MTEDDVRGAVTRVCDAIVGGDVEQVIGSLSDELRRNVGEVVALLPLPASEASIDSITSTGGGAAYVATLAIVGETDEVKLETRWKDRGGEPKIVEVSHLSRTEREPAPEGEEGELDAGAATAEGTEPAS